MYIYIYICMDYFSSDYLFVIFEDDLFGLHVMASRWMFRFIHVSPLKLEAYF